MATLLELLRQIFPDEKQLGSAVHIVVNNVVDYFIESKLVTDWNIGRDFPVWTPPLKNIFFEYRFSFERFNTRNREAVSADRFARMFMGTEDIGIAMTTKDFLEGSIDDQVHFAQTRVEDLTKQLESIDALTASLHRSGQANETIKRILTLGPVARVLAFSTYQHIALLSTSATALEVAFFRQRIKNGKAPRWYVEATIWRRQSDRSATPVWKWAYPVDHAGAFSIETIKDGWLLPTPLYSAYIEKIANNDYEFFLQSSSSNSHRFMVAVLAINFMHCKNVTVKQFQPETSKKGHAKHLAKPYYYLEIDPDKVTVKANGQRPTAQAFVRQHIVRGSFATYSADHPLFGKYAGTYWRPQHLRGTPDAGKINKGYDVHPKSGPT